MRRRKPDSASSDDRNDTIEERGLKLRELGRRVAWLLSSERTIERLWSAIQQHKETEPVPPTQITDERVLRKYERARKRYDSHLRELEIRHQILELSVARSRKEIAEYIAIPDTWCKVRIHREDWAVGFYIDREDATPTPKYRLVVQRWTEDLPELHSNSR